MDKLDRLQNIARDQEIDGWRIRLYFHSRNLGLLTLLALAILGCSAALAWLVRNPDLHAQAVPGTILKAELAKPQPDCASVMRLIPEHRAALGLGLEADETATWIGASALSEPQKSVALALHESLTLGGGEPNADLVYFAHYVKPLPFANEAMGDFHLASKDREKALRYYQRELQVGGSESAREKLLGLAYEKRDRETLRKLAADPGLSGKLPAPLQLAHATLEHRWADLVQPLTQLQLTAWKPIPLFLAAVAGVVWIAILLQLIQPPHACSFRVLVPLLAVGAGMLSTIPTLVVSLWQEELMGLRHTGEFVDDLLFFVAGVGPREELVKMLFFVPFVPWLIVRKSRLEMIVTAGCVGLGFAIAENLQYFAEAGAAAAFGRFLTANFFHVAATGLIGLALCEVCVQPLKKLLPFAGTLLAVMLAHGVYDAFLAVKELIALIIVSMMTLMLVSLFFFRKLRAERDGSTDQLSIGATLILGLAVLSGSMLVCAARTLGFTPALVCLAASSITLAMVAYMFYWQLGEGMAEEQTETRPYL